MSMTKQEAIESLRKELKPGDTVFTVLRHVSRSGLQRKIDAYVIRDNRPRWLTYWISLAVGIPFDKKKDALTVHGFGMDMGFHVVYELGSTLWPKGDGAYVTGGNGDTKPETVGGCLLKQEWL